MTSPRPDTQAPDSHANPTRFIPPLAFQPIFKEKVWGGRHMHDVLAKELPGDPETPIGESWELADLGQTSPTGGGGSAERSRVADGPLAGMALQDLITEYNSAILGSLPLNQFNEFPLLVKFLDARQNLSVQVHPSPQYAAEHKDAFLKNEAWYIVHAEPDARIYKGVKPGTTADQFRDAIKQGTLESLLQSFPARPGDCHDLPSGTVHALGAGIVVAEVQTPSDTTFRVYDWGRTDRDLHIQQALDSMTLDPTPTQPPQNPARWDAPIQHQPLASCEQFRIDRLHTPAEHRQPLRLHQPRVWMIIQGEGLIEPRGDADQVAGAGTGERRFSLGQTLLLPPGMGPTDLTLAPDTTWLEITFPAVE